MTDTPARRAVGLGEVEPARSRHTGRRSTVVLTDETIVTGTGTAVLAHDRTTLDRRWTVPTKTPGTAAVSAEPFDGGVAVGERGPAGEIRLYDVDSGAVRWRYATAADVGEPRKETRFFRPFVVDVTADGDRLYAAARRYEREDDRRSFMSVVYSFDASGDVVWRYGADASPIGLDVRGRRLAVAYNRCPGDHRHGLVVLDAETGNERYRWDPGTTGRRRVGDASLLDGGVVAACHGDHRGYRLGPDGEDRWHVDLATPRDVDGETLYAYPNYVHATGDAVVFVTGNTYPAEGREADSLHPREHTVFGYATDGERLWTATIGGFAGVVGADDDLVAVPSAQHFRTRDPDVHGLAVFDGTTGRHVSFDTAGVATAASIDDGTVAAVEEPVDYHDDGHTRGSHRLHVGSVL